MLEIGGVDPIAQQERAYASPVGSLRLAVHWRGDGNGLGH
jgi:hypothetical protein